VKLYRKCKRLILLILITAVAALWSIVAIFCTAGLARLAFLMRRDDNPAAPVALCAASVFLVTLLPPAAWLILTFV